MEDDEDDEDEEDKKLTEDGKEYKRLISKTTELLKGLIEFAFLKILIKIAF